MKYYKFNQTGNKIQEILNKADKLTSSFEAYEDGHVEVQTVGSTDESVVTKGYVDARVPKNELKTGYYIINDDYNFEYVGEGEYPPEDYGGAAIFIGDDGLHYLENYYRGIIRSSLEISNNGISVNGDWSSIEINDKSVITEPDLAHIEEVEVDFSELEESIEVNVEDLMNGKDIVIVRQRNSSERYVYVIQFPVNSMFFDTSIFTKIENYGILENIDSEASFSISAAVKFRIVKLGTMYFISEVVEI